MEVKRKCTTFASESYNEIDTMMEQTKMEMTQDELYEYLTAHDVKLVRLAELMGKTLAVVSSCFLHHKNVHGYARRFSVENVQKLNEALPVIARELRGCVMRFGKKPVCVVKQGRTYYPGMVEPMKRVGEYMNLVPLTERLMGWNERKKANVLASDKNKAYGNIMRGDVVAVNKELLEVAGVLDGTEVVADDEAYDGGSSNIENVDSE